MFENEKFTSVNDQTRDFFNVAGKLRKNDDLDDVFTDNIRIGESDERSDKRNKDKAINEHARVAESLDKCQFCIQSTHMQKHLMVSLGEVVYLSLPHYEPLTDGHCILVRYSFIHMFVTFLTLITNLVSVKMLKGLMQRP